MPEPRICHLPNSTTLACIGVEHLGLAEALQCQCPGLVVSDITELGGRR
jgi:hypothetical protein